MESNKKRKLALLFLCFIIIGQSAADYTGGTRKLIPVGRTVAVEIETQGVVITALTKVDTGSGEAEPAYEAGLRSGDIIEYIGSRRIDCAADIKTALEEGGELSVRYIRGGEQYQTSVSPVLGASGRYELGVWLRSGLSGLGTVTYIDPESGSFGALGHSVSDSETGVVLPVREGHISFANIEGAVKGKKGSPRELRGNSEEEGTIGIIERNNECGIFGTADPSAFGDGEALKVMQRGELKCGEAYLLSDVGDGPEKYKAEISRVYRGADGTRDFLITVTDDKLISLTGGIVQGMSGSPVIQSGKIVGAVTHVLINDPTKGYGVFIDRMLEAAA